ncbi:MAG: SpoIID/LytB domain-containing protein [Lachnospiraceae bacterium]|nr:SpoIID/LytB domain-containing protein [Lachnospiraceae bacterium]
MDAKVYENVFYKNKRIVTDKNSFNAKIIGTVLLFLFLLPYIITSLWGNVNDGEVNENNQIIWGEASASKIYIENVTAAGRERIPLELYLADKLARSINTDYHPEALKAQAVLLRTALIYELWSLNGAVSGIIKAGDSEYGRGIINENVLLAVNSTQGIILKYHNQPIKVAYFAVSNGRTRESGEALGKTDLPYLKSVDCSRDFLAENYTSQKVMNKSQFIAAIEKTAKTEVPFDLSIEMININRDSGNYIIDLTINIAPEPIVLSGEECRYIWGLNSSCFTIDESKNKIIFGIRGVGHGLGMSQFAANEMAKADNDYMTILEYFFAGTMMEKL